MITRQKKGKRKEAKKEAKETGLDPKKLIVEEQRHSFSNWIFFLPVKLFLGAVLLFLPKPKAFALAENCQSDRRKINQKKFVSHSKTMSDFFFIRFFVTDIFISTIPF